uniref:PIG-L deacetylase family protein n=1 Tax=Agathobacter sp. TaxID=2021311 RepID=UPI0040569A5C
MNVLVIAPHPDDEVLGCGGTIAKHVANGDIVYVVIVTKGTSPMFSEELVEQVRKECREADKLLGVKETIFLDFPAARMEEVQRFKINDSLVKIIQDKKPEIVYIPHRGDMQLDHKQTVDAAMVALRPRYKHIPQKIYCYETLSETGWDIPNTVNEFIPNSYNDISEYLDKKIKAMRIFTTQVAEFPNARSIEAIKALAIYRGTNMRMEAAEAFMMLRELIGGTFSG